MLLYRLQTDMEDATSSLLASTALLIVRPLLLIHLIRCIAYWSSTVYGNVFRSRTTLPLMAGMQLWGRSFLLSNPGWVDFGSTGLEIGIIDMMILRLGLLNHGFIFAYIYRSDGLSGPYWDDRFDVKAEWEVIRWCGFLSNEHETSPEEKTEGGQNTKRERDPVYVRVKSVCGRPLPGECTQRRAFWPETRLEMFLLQAAAISFVFRIL